MVSDASLPSTGSGSERVSLPSRRPSVHSPDSCSTGGSADEIGILSANLRNLPTISADHTSNSWRYLDIFQRYVHGMDISGANLNEGIVTKPESHADRRIDMSITRPFNRHVLAICRFNRHGE
jgi:hypothetical protein